MDEKHESLLDIIDLCSDGAEVKEKIFSDRPFAREIIEGTLDFENLSTFQMEDVLITAIYLNVNTEKYVDEFLWRTGESQSAFNRYFEQFSKNRLDQKDEGTFLKQGILYKLKSKENSQMANNVIYSELVKIFGCNQLFHKEKMCARFSTINLANCIKEGNLRLLKYARSQTKNQSNIGYSSFASLGVLESYSEKEPPWTEELRLNTKKNGQLECLKYAEKHGLMLSDDVCEWAAKSGNLTCLMYAHEKGYKWTADTCMYAAIGGHLECLRYAHEHGCKWDVKTCAFAAYSGKLECLKYAHEHGCHWDYWTCTYAAMRGHLECLKYAHEQGCEWNSRTCESAASSGQLECLKYAHEHGCGWDYGTCEYAAQNGHLECLKYAHENGCEWDKFTIIEATKNEKFECLDYALTHGCST